MPVPLLPPPAFPPKRCWHLQIQPRTPAPVAPVGQGGLAALGVRWARGGRLTPSLLGRPPAPCPPCCPAKGKEEEGVGGSPQSPPHTAIPQPGSPCAMCTVATRGSSKIINAFLPFFPPPPPLCSAPRGPHVPAAPSSAQGLPPARRPCKGTPPRGASPGHGTLGPGAPGRPRSPTSPWGEEEERG